MTIPTAGVVRLQDALNDYNITDKETLKALLIREWAHNAFSHGATKMNVFPYVFNNMWWIMGCHDGRPCQDNADVHNCLRFHYSKDPDLGTFGHGSKAGAISLPTNTRHIGVGVFSQTVDEGLRVALLSSGGQAMAQIHDVTTEWSAFLTKMLDPKRKGDWKVGYMACMGPEPTPEVMQNEALSGISLRTMQVYRQINPGNFDDKKVNIIQRTIGAPGEPSTWPEMESLVRLNKQRGKNYLESPAKFREMYLRPEYTQEFTLPDIEVQFRSKQFQKNILKGSWRVEVAYYLGFVANYNLMADRTGHLHRQETSLWDSLSVYMPAIQELSKEDRHYRFTEDPVHYQKHRIKPITDALDISVPSDAARSYDDLQDWKDYEEYSGNRSTQRVLARKSWMEVKLFFDRFERLDVIEQDGTRTPCLNRDMNDAPFLLPTYLGGVASMFYARDDKVLTSICEKVVGHIQEIDPLGLKSVQEIARKVFPVKDLGAIPMPIFSDDKPRKLETLRVTDAKTNREIKTLAPGTKTTVIISNAVLHTPLADLKTHHRHTRGVDMKDHKGGMYTLKVAELYQVDENGERGAVADVDWKNTKEFGPSRNVYVHDKDGTTYKLNLKIQVPVVPKAETDGDENDTGEAKPKKPKGNKAAGGNGHANNKETTTYLQGTGNPEHYYRYRKGHDACPNADNPIVSTMFTGWDYTTHAREKNQLVDLHRHLVRRARELDSIEFGGDFFSSEEEKAKYQDDVAWYILDQEARAIFTSPLYEDLHKKITSFKGN